MNETASVKRTSTAPTSTAQMPILPTSMETQISGLQTPTRAAQPPLPPAYTRYAEYSSNISAAQVRPRRRLIVNAPTLIYGSHHSVNRSSCQQIRSSIMLLHMINSSVLADRDVVLNCGLTVVATDGNTKIPNILHPQSWVEGQQQQQQHAQTQGQFQANMPLSQHQQQQKHNMTDNGRVRLGIPVTRDTAQDVTSPSLNNDGNSRTNVYPRDISSSFSSIPQPALVSANTPACVSHGSGVDMGEANKNESVSKATAHRKCSGSSHLKERKRKLGVCNSPPKNSSFPISTRSNGGEFAAENSTAQRLTRLQKRQLMKAVSILKYSVFPSLSNHPLGSRKKARREIKDGLYSMG